MASSSTISSVSRTVYFYSHFAQEVRTHLEAGAFRSVCNHLSDRSDNVQNIDLMIVGGFCRNCMAKWLVKEARAVSAEIESSSPKGAALLDAYGHSQAARDVYGCDFFRWKKKHPQKATFEQMRKYQESEHLHAVHKEDTTLKTGMTVAMTTEFEAKFKMRVEAGAFRSLCNHLRARSDAVQNIDLMTMSGFCRNCLAKWLVIEARKLAETIQGVCQNSFTEEEEQLVRDLDAFGYDEAAEYVYGCAYSDWKKAHGKKASHDQVAKYKSSIPIHARHDKKLLEPQCEKGPGKYDGTPPSEETEQVQQQQEVHAAVSAIAELSSSPSPSPHHSVASPQARPGTASTSTSASRTKKSAVPASDVCCEDVDNGASIGSRSVATAAAVAYRIPRPPKVNLSLRVGILTVSDRAANNEYEKGDLSGPAVEQSLAENIGRANSRRGELDDSNAMVSFVLKAIVPDDMDSVVQHLKQWCGVDGDGPICDIVFTTGGTGFSPRDITPEATKQVIEKDASGLMSFVTAECAKIQPLAPLSRGIAGICKDTIIVNLPGNPAGVGQVLDLLVPLLLHAVKGVKGL